MNGSYPPPHQPYPPQPYQTPAPAVRPLHKMKRVWAGGVAILVIGTGCGAAMSENDGTAPAGSAKAGPQPTVTVTATATETARPTATATKTVTATPAEKPKKADDKPAEKAPTVEMGTLPNLVGLTHQDAQDTAQAAGFYSLREKDHTGMERMLLMDRNWKVCKQEPTPGKHAVEKTITLYSVKQTESC
ncbi:PASTA domain-containing protein [Streptomyces sp. NPDC005805]|uniref:PASTA domain-containing protein n=1 Tax=Streptomyces sp. NPDC005805 TaxID=3157068 RepID=UPI0033C320AB